MVLDAVISPDTAVALFEVSSLDLMHATGLVWASRRLWYHLSHVPCICWLMHGFSLSVQMREHRGKELPILAQTLSCDPGWAIGPFALLPTYELRVPVVCDRDLKRSQKEHHQ